MKIGILTTFVKSEVSGGYYNLQDEGLAKELAKNHDCVYVYRVVDKKYKGRTDKFNERITIEIIPSYRIHHHGIIDFNTLSSDIDVLIYFSDNQLMVNSVYKWCKKNEIILLPYIGSTGVNKINVVKDFIKLLLFLKNIRVYRKCICLAKNPVIVSKLRYYNINRIILAPIGLDINLLNQNYRNIDINDLKHKWGYCDKDKVILFIGELSPIKCPMKMLEIFEKVYQHDSSYRLLIVGRGKQSVEIKNKINKTLGKLVKLIDVIPNTNIWELYRLSSVYINLAPTEIFGMAILEAMYYECNVIARHAPGPDYIIENNINGLLCNTDDEIVEGILNKNAYGKAAHKRIIGNFTWRTTADIINEHAIK